MTLIAQITDLHLRPAGMPCYRVSETNMLAERAISALLAFSPQPDAVVITGDLTHKSDPAEYKLARQLLSRLPMPVYLMPGNHDLSDDMRKTFSDYPGIDEAQGSKLFYAVTIGALRLVALDTGVADSPRGTLGTEQLDWLAYTLEETDQPTIIALHHPPALTDIGTMNDIGLSDADDLADIIGMHDHVERIICGHVHRTVISSFAGTIMTIAPGTAHQTMLKFSTEEPGRFAMEPPAFFLHRYTPRTGLVSHLSYVEQFPGPYPFATASRTD